MSLSYTERKFQCQLVRTKNANGDGTVTPGCTLICLDLPLLVSAETREEAVSVLKEQIKTFFAHRAARLQTGDIRALRSTCSGSLYHRIRYGKGNLTLTVEFPEK